MRRIVPIAVIAVGVVLAATAASAAARGASGIRNARYCELLVATGALPRVTVTVYNTLGLNRCPPARWRTYDAGRLATRLGALTVILNGPRHFMMDRASAPATDPVRRIGALRFRKVATLRIATARGLVQRPYQPRTVYRDNTFAWRKGRRVYELVSPGGRVYVMQAYSQIVDRHLRARDLRHLGRRLDLPPGWRYRVRVPRRPLVLTTNTRRRPAVIVRDELLNTYQLVSGRTRTDGGHGARRHHRPRRH